MDKNNKYLQEEILRMSGVNPRKCMSCGKCSATCPAYDEMEYHPHQFVSMVKNGDIERLLNSQSLYRCLSLSLIHILFAILTLIGFIVGENVTGNLAGGQTMAFMVLSLSQIVQALSLIHTEPYQTQNAG